MFGQPQASTGFAFGQQSSASPFGTGTTPAFGASSTAGFGTATTPAFGASTGAGGFGAGSTPAFGASSGGSLFSTSTPAFGAASAPAFGSSQPASSTTTFSFAASSAPAFGQTPQPTLLGFGQQPAQQAQQQQAQVPYTRATPFNELPPAAQNQLQQIQ
jgi:nuclear pore complex protein Nup98-Nup96